jgi:hypothetical protein
MDELGFEGVEEALHRGIVIAIGLAAHRGLDSRRTVSPCDNPQKHIEHPDQNDESGPGERVSPRWPSATLPTAVRCANDRPSSSRLTRRHHEGVVERGKDTAARPGVEITLYRRIRWEVLGQLPPLATDGRNIKDRICYRSQICRTWTPKRRCRWQKRLYHKPLCIGRIDSISQALAPITNAKGRFWGGKIDLGTSGKQQRRVAFGN